MNKTGGMKGIRKNRNELNNKNVVYTDTKCKGCAKIKKCEAAYTKPDPMENYDCYRKE